MIRLGNEEDNKYSYWFDEKTQKVYKLSQLDLNGGDDSVNKAPRGLIFLACSPGATIIGVLFGDKILNSDNWFIVFFLLSVVLGIIVINKLLNYVIDKDDGYIRRIALGERATYEEVRGYYLKGKKIRRIGRIMVWVGVLACMIAILMYQIDRSIISLIVFFGGLFGGFSFLKFLQPVRCYHMFKRLKKKKEKGVS